jgi:ACR3 family arsenite efflux pump ArsB
MAALYGLHAIGCAFGWSTGQLRLGLSAALLAHVVAIGLMWLHLARADSNAALGSTASLLHLVSLWMAIAAFVATLFTFGPPLLLTACL